MTRTQLAGMCRSALEQEILVLEARLWAEETNRKAAAAKIAFLQDQLARVVEARPRILSMMVHRGWSTHWIHRSAYLHLEAAELAEAVRGKRGDTLEESADVLITMLALSPHGLPEILAAALAKVERLETAPPYVGEERCLIS